jgi:hypothetical protein
MSMVDDEHNIKKRWVEILYNNVFSLFYMEVKLVLERKILFKYNLQEYNF